MLRVVIDTREQQPWSFPADRFETERRGLPTGDYTVAGLEDRLAVERKSVGDAVNTVIHGWLRFRKELTRLSGFDLAVLVIEGEAADIAEGRYDSDANPESVFGRLAEVTIDHGVPVMFWGPRRRCEPRVWQFLRLAAKRLGVPG